MAGTKVTAATLDWKRPGGGGAVMFCVGPGFATTGTALSVWNRSLGRPTKAAIRLSEGTPTTTGLLPLRRATPKGVRCSQSAAPNRLQSLSIAELGTAPRKDRPKARAYPKSLAKHRETSHTSQWSAFIRRHRRPAVKILGLPGSDVPCDQPHAIPPILSVHAMQPPETERCCGPISNR